MAIQSTKISYQSTKISSKATSLPSFLTYEIHTRLTTRFPAPRFAAPQSPPREEVFWSWGLRACFIYMRKSKVGEGGGCRQECASLTSRGKYSRGREGKRSSPTQHFGHSWVLFVTRLGMTWPGTVANTMLAGYIIGIYVGDSFLFATFQSFVELKFWPMKGYYTFQKHLL